MKTPNQSNLSSDKPRTVEDIIRAIEKKSADGSYIFRGEPQCYKRVSSNLFRELDAINAQYSNIKKIEAGIVAEAKAYTNKTDNSEIRYDLQHYGGKTNLIDFTTDYNVALFFACYGSPTESGRVIILRETEKIKEMLRHPKTPEIRVGAQKSIFVEPLKGYIEQKYEVIRISKDLKLLILQHLQETVKPEISPKTIYNDIHGFIRSHNDNWMAYRDFYNGLTSENKANEAKTLKEKRKAYKEAIDHYTNALDQNLQLVPVYNNRGNAYNKIDEHNLAIADYNTAIGLNRNLAESYNNRGTAYGKNGESEHAIKDYTEAVRLKPDYTEAYNNRGNAYRKQEDLQQAIEDYTKAIELKPDYIKSYSSRGYAYGCRGDYREAIADYTKTIALKPDDANAYNNRGVVHGKKSEYDLAIADFNTALELKPDYPEAYSNRGVAYMKKGELDRALQDHIKAIELKPDYAEAYNNRGNVYVAKDECDLAIKDCNKAIKLKPDYAEAYYNRAVAYGKKNEIDHAIADFSIAIQLKPDYFAAYNNLGVAYYNTGEFDRAIKNYNLALKLKPDYAEAYNNRRAVYSAKRMDYYEKNKSNSGIDYTEAIRKNPDDPSAYYNRGEAFLRGKLWDRGGKDLMRAKEMGADIVDLFHNRYANITDFEQENRVKLPEDIAAMLTSA